MPTAAPATVTGGLTTSTHCPRQVTEELRDHLARHDKPLAFLIGAGTSAAINIAPVPPAGTVRGYKPLIPPIVPLTKTCCDAVCLLGVEFENAWTQIVAQCPAGPPPANLEDILSLVRQKLDALRGVETLLSLNLDGFKKIDKTIRATIAKEVNPSESLVPERIPQDALATWIRGLVRTAPIEIFTTNYDILIERSLELANVAVFDGFVGSFQPHFMADSLAIDGVAPRDAVRLWKIHGSINWELIKCRGVTRVIRTKPSGTGEMVLPSHQKYEESRKQPYLALLDRLTHVLRREDCMVVSLGFSFADQHINAVLFDALDGNPRTHLIALQYEDLADSHPLVAAAASRKNISVVCPSRGIVGGRSGTWKMGEPLDDPIASLMATVFKPDATTPPVDGLPVGKVTIGDFNQFASFLAEMSTDRIAK